MLRKTLFGSAALTGAAVLVAATFPHSDALAAGGAAAGRVYRCTGFVTYAPQGGQEQTYFINFEITPGGSFEDDFSTATRWHIFSAQATNDGPAVVIGFDFFSDVSALAEIDVSSEVRLTPGQMSDSTHGHHQSYHSASGAYTVTYSLDCQVVPTRQSLQ